MYLRNAHPTPIRQFTHQNCKRLTTKNISCFFAVFFTGECDTGAYFAQEPLRPPVGGVPGVKTGCRLGRSGLYRKRRLFAVMPTVERRRPPGLTSVYMPNGYRTETVFMYFAGKRQIEDPEGNLLCGRRRGRQSALGHLPVQQGHARQAILPYQAFTVRTMSLLGNSK